MVRFFDPGKSYLKIREEISVEIDRVLTAGDLILRDDVEKFEQNLAQYVGTKYAVGLNSGTDALYLALRAAGIKQYDKIITCSHTFVSTVQVIELCKARPRLVDISYNGLMDVEKINKEVLKKTKAIIAVQLTGQICDMKAILEIAEKHNLIVIEDACQALGAEQEGKKAGSFGLAGCFSFYPAKILGCFGDGGALVTNDEVMYNEVKELRNHYKKDYSKWGVNSRLDNIQAAILNVRLKYLPNALERRKQIAERYLSELKTDLFLPENQPGRVWQDFIVRTKLRDRLYDFLKEQGIETMKNKYPFPIPKKPISVEYEAQTLRIPCNENLTDEEVGCVIEKINSFYGV